MKILITISTIIFIGFAGFMVLGFIAYIIDYIIKVANIFKKYPDIWKYWFREGSYNTSLCYNFEEFRPYKTKNGDVIEVNGKDGEVLYKLKTFIECLLFILFVFILIVGFVLHTLCIIFNYFNL
jgi:hypothetical protein